MSKLMRIIAIVVAVLAVVSTPGSAAGDGADIKGVGGGWVGFPPLTSEKYVQFSFSAHTGPNGDFGHGHFRIEDELVPVEWTVDVDCLSVFAFPMLEGMGWFSGVVTKVDDPTGFWAPYIFVGGRSYFSIYDGGGPSTVPVDSIEGWLDLGVSCKDLAPYTTPPDVTHGNIVIAID